METFFFYFLSISAVGAALMVTLARNAVNAAMFMILCLIATAGLFAMLGSYFLAALQVLVYAGAIMVLFVFIVMLLDVEQESKRKFKTASLISALIALLFLVAGVIGVAMFDPIAQPFPDIEQGNPDPLAFGSEARRYGVVLFGKYMLPIQMMGFLLIVAMVGVILLSKNLWNRLGLPSREAASNEENPQS